MEKASELPAISCIRDDSIARIIHFQKEWYTASIPFSLLLLYERERKGDTEIGTFWQSVSVPLAQASQLARIRHTLLYPGFHGGLGTEPVPSFYTPSTLPSSGPDCVPGLPDLIPFSRALPPWSNHWWLSWFMNFLGGHKHSDHSKRKEQY